MNNQLQQSINFCIQLLACDIDKQEAVKLAMYRLDMDIEDFIDKVQVELIRQYKGSVRKN